MFLLLTTRPALVPARLQHSTYIPELTGAGPTPLSPHATKPHVDSRLTGSAINRFI